METKAISLVREYLGGPDTTTYVHGWRGSDTFMMRSLPFKRLNDMLNSISVIEDVLVEHFGGAFYITVKWKPL